VSASVYGHYIFSNQSYFQPLVFYGDYIDLSALAFIAFKAEIPKNRPLAALFVVNLGQDLLSGLPEITLLRLIFQLE